MPAYPNLEPNHVLREVEYGVAVMCPFEVINGHVTLHISPVTQTAIWAKTAEPDEYECPVCEVLNGQVHYIGSPDCSEDEGIIEESDDATD